MPGRYDDPRYGRPRRGEPRSTWRGPGAGRRYDATLQRYGYDYGRYGAEYGRYGTPFPGAAGYPSARWGWSPIGWMGWGPGMEFWPYAGLPAYGWNGSYRPPHRPPEESPFYGRRADRALRRWAARYGYDLEYSIEPRQRR